MPSSYDAIVVGARCAGSSTAMLLARAGHRVLLLDRASFPSDTMSTHPEAAAGFVSVIAGTLPASEFFAPDNVQRIMASAAPVEG